MIKSMTGFGRAAMAHGEDAGEGAESFIVEIKAVNHRYLDMTCRLNDRFFALEPLIKEEIKKRFSRGSFTVLIYADSSAAPPLKINIAAARACLEAADELKRELGVKGEIGIEGLLRIKEIFSAPKKTAGPGPLWDALKGRLSTVFDEVDAWRTREGHALEQDIRGRLGSLEALLAQVEERAPFALAAYADKLRSDMEKILKDRLDEARIFAEAALYAEKTDISEEITRLKSHFKLFREYLDAGGAVGKKLDFLCQEFFREINTIGSKAGDAAMTKTVVEMKGGLEKIREQVQNIE